METAFYFDTDKEDVKLRHYMPEGVTSHNCYNKKEYGAWKKDREKKW